MQSNFIEIARRRGCSPVNLLHIFRTPFPKNSSGKLLLHLRLHLNDHSLVRDKMSITQINGDTLTFLAKL